MLVKITITIIVDLSTNPSLFPYYLPPYSCTLTNNANGVAPLTSPEKKRIFNYSFCNLNRFDIFPEINANRYIFKTLPKTSITITANTKIHE